MTCNHNINENMSTLVELPIQFMVYPPRKFYECKICGEVFEYILNEENGRYIQKPSKEDSTHGFSRDD